MTKKDDSALKRAARGALHATAQLWADASVAGARILWQPVLDASEQAGEWVNERKRAIDGFVEPKLWWLAANAGYLIGVDQAIETIAQHTDTLEGPAIASTYLTALAAWPSLINGRFKDPITKRWHKGIVPYVGDLIKERTQKRDARGDVHSWLASAGKASLTAATIALGVSLSAYERLGYDAARVVGAFARPDTTEQMIRPTRELTDVIEQHPAGPGPLETGALAGRRLGDLYEHYSGVSGPWPDNITIDFAERLEHLWSLKHAKNGSSQPVRELRAALLAEYTQNEPTRMTLNEYIATIERRADAVDEQIDWSQLARLEGLNQDELRITRALADRVDGRVLASYMMAELMPSNDGRLNAAMTDLLLRGGGREFIESIPAIHDPYASFGPYQFTSLALNGPRRAGASIANEAMPIEHQIPGSVNLLRADDHHTAAKLFAIHNLARMVGGLDRRLLDKLERIVARDGEELDSNLAQCVAAAHTLPRDAHRAWRLWIDNDATTQYWRSLANKRAIGYAQRAKANHAYLVR